MLNDAGLRSGGHIIMRQNAITLWEEKIHDRRVCVGVSCLHTTMPQNRTRNTNKTNEKQITAENHRIESKKQYNTAQEMHTVRMAHSPAHTIRMSETTGTCRRGHLPAFKPTHKRRGLIHNSSNTHINPHPSGISPMNRPRRWEPDP